MADTTFIEFNNCGFWIPSPFIEVLSEYICETFESIGVNTLSLNLQKIYINCNLNRKGELIGMVDISLDQYITNNDDKATFISVLNQTKTLISSKGPELSIEVLTDFENRKTDDYFKIPWAFPIKTQSLVATINIIIQMLNGTWTSNSYNVYYVGFPNISQYDEI